MWQNFVEDIDKIFFLLHDHSDFYEEISEELEELYLYKCKSFVMGYGVRAC